MGLRDSLILEYLEETIGRHVDIESNFDEGSEGSNGDGEKGSIVLENFYIVNSDDRNMNVKGASGETSDRNEEHGIDSGGKTDPVIKWLKTWLNGVLLSGETYKPC